MAEITVDITRLANGDGLALPSYKSAGAAGMDLEAALSAPLVLSPGDRHPVPTGFAIALPEGYEAQVRPRSGFALKHGITVANAPGTIDSDYRGEIAVIIVNLGRDAFTIERGMRIAQMVVAPVTQCQLNMVAALDNSHRGSDGFGSTGV